MLWAAQCEVAKAIDTGDTAAGDEIWQMKEKNGRRVDQKGKELEAIGNGSKGERGCHRPFG